MADRALTGSQMTVRKEQSMVATTCSICYAKFSNPSRAATHVKKHRKQAIRTSSGGVNAPSYSIPDTVVCLPTCMDRGAYWASTTCLCDCHFQGPTARQMIKQAAEAGVEELYDD